MTSDLDRRLEALAEAVELADGRLDPDRVAAARAVVGRAGARLGLDLHSTVAALAGATGSGKSSILNALVGADVSAVGVRRPTTSSAVAAVWGDGGGAILDWLDVPRRHRVADGRLDGLVVLDLPDSDSLERSHRLQAERLIALVDLLVWVVDPQKYADAALHERYLRPLETHEESMLVVLNQADVMAPAELEACRADLRRLLAEDGLAGVPILVASARTGDGLAGLREALAERVASRRAAATRLSADVTAVAAALAADGVDGEARRIRDAERERLVDALADAAGVPTVTRAVARAHRARGAMATGWLFLRWLGRLRPDALRRLHLGGGGGGAGRTSLPGPSPVQRARVTRATRELAAQVSRDLPAPWPALVRSAATSGEGDLPDQLDRAVARTELPTRAPRWWQAARFLQALLAAVTVAGALWLLGLAALGYVQLGDVVPTPEIGRFPLPTLLLGGGILAGLALAGLARLVNRLGARRRARTAERALRREIETVGSENVIGPVERELDAYARLRAALETARGKRGRRAGGALLRRGDGGLRRPLARSAGRPA